MQLTDFEGIGEALATRIVKAFGTPEAFVEAARRMEVDRLTAVDGISTKKAVEIILTVQGREPLDFLRTPRAETLYEDVLDRVKEFANTDHARNRISLLVPLADREQLDANLDFVMEARDRVRSLPVDELAKLLRKVHPPRTPRPKFDGSIAVLVDEEADYEALVKEGLDKHCQVLTPEDASFGSDFEVIVYAYTTGALDLTGVDNVVQVPFTREKGDLLPEAALQYHRENRPLWETVREAQRLLGRPTVLDDVLATLDAAGAQDVDFQTVEDLVRGTATSMNEALTREMKTLSLGGDEVLQMMSGETPRKVLDLQGRVLREGRERIMEATGEDFSVFTDGFPVQVDEAALEAKRAEYLGRKKRAAFREKVEAARKLTTLRPKVEKEVQGLLEFDYSFALGRFAHEYALERPRFGRGFKLKGALHLNLIRQGGKRIDYELGGKHHVVLLTGANSGGKTTLLETLGQCAILAHLGLPVNAQDATVDPVEAVYFFTQKRSLDAGAFESFLRGFIPIVTSPTKKLVLADELEAMTELEAASKIVGTFIELLLQSKSYGVCVTHMAEEVSKHTTVRIDGIEAKGLDEDYNLIVDRTPRMGYRARSTPELILQRLANKSTGPERKVYESILSKF